MADALFEEPRLARVYDPLDPDRDDLVAYVAIAEARAKGKARIEGKDYVMHDGDVVEFRFSKT